MNILNAQRLKAVLQLHPEKYDQDVFWSILPEADKPTFYNCGTVACLAGWSCVLQYNADIHDEAIRKLVEPNMSAIARDWLGIDQETASILFAGVECWPARFKFEDAASPQYRVGKAVEFLDFLIAGGSVVDLDYDEDEEEDEYEGEEYDEEEDED